MNYTKLIDTNVKDMVLVLIRILSKIKKFPNADCFLPIFFAHNEIGQNNPDYKILS